MTPQARRNATHTLEIYAAQSSPSAASCIVYAPDGSTLLASGAATADAASESIVTGLAGSDTLTVASSTGFAAGLTYRITASDGRTIDLPLVSLTTTSLTFAGEIPWTTTGGTATSSRVTRSWTTPDYTWRSCRVVWSYTSALVTYTEETELDIVRTPFALRVSSADVLRAEQLYTDGSGRNPALQIAEACDDVRRKLLGMQLCPDLVRDRSILEKAAVWRTLWARHIRNEALRSVFDEQYTAEFERFAAAKSWYDSDDDAEMAYSPEDNSETERVIPVKYMRIG